MIGRTFLPELVNNGYKFTLEDIIFITKDKEDKLVWLERGNEYGGLNHILKNHSEDFEIAFGIKGDEISLYLYNAITYGTMVRSTLSKIEGGFDRIYEYDGDYYTFVGMGDNGFIVTSFPTGKLRRMP